LCPVPCGVSLWIFFQYIRDFSKFFRACPHHLINLGDLLIWTVELMFAICILKQLGCVHPWLLGEEEPAENCKGISSRRQFVSRSCWWVLHCGVSVIKLHSCFIFVPSYLTALRPNILIRRAKDGTYSVRQCHFCRLQMKIFIACCLCKRDAWLDVQ
jgi:hypothetical protein